MARRADSVNFQMEEKMNVFEKHINMIDTYYYKCAYMQGVLAMCRAQSSKTWEEHEKKVNSAIDISTKPYDILEKFKQGAKDEYNSQ